MIKMSIVVWLALIVSLLSLSVSIFALRTLIRVDKTLPAPTITQPSVAQPLSPSQSTWPADRLLHEAQGELYQSQKHLEKAYLLIQDARAKNNTKP